MSVRCTLLESGLSTQAVLARSLHMQIALMLQVPSASAFDLITNAATSLVQPHHGQNLANLLSVTSN